MDNTLHGTVCGKTVVLTSDPGLLEGQQVEVVLRPVCGEQKSPQSAAGMLSDKPELDASIAKIEQDRKMAHDRTDSL